MMARSDQIKAEAGPKWLHRSILLGKRWTLSNVNAALLDDNLHGRPVDDIAAALSRRKVPFFVRHWIWI